MLRKLCYLPYYSNNCAIENILNAFNDTQAIQNLVCSGHAPCYN